MEVWRAAVLKTCPEVENIYLTILTKNEQCTTACEMRNFIYLIEKLFNATLLYHHKLAEKKIPHVKVTERQVSLWHIAEKTLTFPSDNASCIQNWVSRIDMLSCVNQ